MAEPITFYSAKECPYAQRVEIALQESKLPYTRFEINLQNKPEWYAPRVNPASKVPAIAYGGDASAHADPSNPSPASSKLAESLILLEFVADLAPDSHLLPADPVLRAKVRFFIDAVSTKLLPAFNAAQARGEDPQVMLDAIEDVQALLPPLQEGAFAVGNVFTIADAAALPFLARAEFFLTSDIGAYDEGAGPRAYETLKTDPKYARFRAYFEELKKRDSFKKTFHPDQIRQKVSPRYLAVREQRKAARAAA